MKTICFYFQVHQPLRLKKYRFFLAFFRFDFPFGV